MIEVRDITKIFGSKLVLDKLSLSINTGESLVIIGRSGCGKSVLLKHIIGLLRPDSGEVLIDGINISEISSAELSKLRMKFGMLFQGAALFDSLNILENVGFRLIEYTDMSFERIRSRVKECLNMVGLEGIESNKPAELSGGMKKRVGLARAITMSPEIILYDEPTTGLDPVMSDSINKLIKELHSTLKVTSITVTHDMRSAFEIADRIAMLHDHRIIAVGTPEEIGNSNNSIVRDFITGNSAHMPASSE